jgi:hypothetical protein
VGVRQIIYRLIRQKDFKGKHSLRISGKLSHLCKSNHAVELQRLPSVRVLVGERILLDYLVLLPVVAEYV